MDRRGQERPRRGGLWRWAGGKSRLLAQLFEHLDPRPRRDECAGLGGETCNCGTTSHPPPFTRWIVPFFGGGADTVEAARRDLAHEFILNDACYDVRCAAQHWHAAEAVLRHALTLHVDAQRELFYRVRDREYVDEVFTFADGTAVNLDQVTWRAFRLLFLQATCFNGIWRVNRQTGKYNVPFGRRGTVGWQALAEFDVLINSRSHLWLTDDFETAVNLARRGDLVYADPPYYGTHDYGCVFKRADHVRLAVALRGAAARGAVCWVSGSDCEETPRIYSPHRTHILEVSRSVSCKAKTRGVKTELLMEIR